VPMPPVPAAVLDDAAESWVARVRVVPPVTRGEKN
jgi:hypothetical protein